MRYLLKMIFNVAIGQDDNDGNGATKPASQAGSQFLNEAQLNTLKRQLEKAGITEQQMCTKAGVSSLGEIHQKRLAGAMNFIKKFEAMQGAPQ